MGTERRGKRIRLIKTAATTYLPGRTAGDFGIRGVGRIWFRPITQRIAASAPLARTRLPIGDRRRHRGRSSTGNAG
jgi:hypothetical protein